MKLEKAAGTRINIDDLSLHYFGMILRLYRTERHAMCQAIVFLKGFWTWYPGVGWYIAIMGLLGVLVPLFRYPEKIGKKEKALWTAVMFVLLVLELRSISLDRKEHDKEQSDARETQLVQFQNIVTQAQTHFDQTMQAFVVMLDNEEKISTATQNTLNEITGGKTYPEVIATFTGSPTASLAIIANGKNSLSDVTVYVRSHMQLSDPKSLWQQFNSVQTASLPLVLGNHLENLPMQIHVEGDLDLYQINVVARNGVFVESLKFTRNSSGVLDQDFQIDDMHGHLFHKFKTPIPATK